MRSYTHDYLVTFKRLNMFNTILSGLQAYSIEGTKHKD